MGRICNNYAFSLFDKLSITSKIKKKNGKTSNPNIVKLLVR